MFSGLPLGWLISVCCQCKRCKKRCSIREKEREAYDAAKSPPEELGTPLFDFYFGIAARNAGIPGEGVLALERYLLHFPDNRSALFHLARGYFILGEDDRAREEFSSLLTDAPGKERESIIDFLDAIRARESRYRPTSSAYVELGSGFDSNINSGISTGQVAGLPAGVIVVPGQSSERQSDFVGTLAVGGAAHLPNRARRFLLRRRPAFGPVPRETKQ